MPWLEGLWQADPVDDVGKLLLDYLVIISAPSLTPRLDLIALVVVVGMLAAAVAVVLLHVIGVLRFGSTPGILATRFEPGGMRGRSVRGRARARAPSTFGVPARA